MSNNAVGQSLTVKLLDRLQDTADLIQCRYNVCVCAKESRPTVQARGTSLYCPPTSAICT